MWRKRPQLQLPVHPLHPRQTHPWQPRHPFTTPPTPPLTTSQIGSPVVPWVAAGTKPTIPEKEPMFPRVLSRHQHRKQCRSPAVATVDPRGTQTQRTVCETWGRSCPAPRPKPPMLPNRVPPRLEPELETWPRKPTTACKTCNSNASSSSSNIHKNQTTTTTTIIHSNAHKASKWPLTLETTPLVGR